MESIKTGVPKGYDKTKSSDSPSGSSDAEVSTLKKTVVALTEENSFLKNKVEELELKLSQYEKSKARGALDDARMTDSIVNGAAGGVKAAAEEEEEEEEED